jgi:hypothetical protein
LKILCAEDTHLPTKACRHGEYSEAPPEFAGGQSSKTSIWNKFQPPWLGGTNDKALKSQQPTVFLTRQKESYVNLTAYSVLVLVLHRSSFALCPCSVRVVPQQSTDSSPLLCTRLWWSRAFRFIIGRRSSTWHPLNSRPGDFSRFLSSLFPQQQN